MKEQAHYSMVLARLHELGDSTAAAEIQEHLDQVTQSIADVDRRALSCLCGFPIQVWLVRIRPTPAQRRR